MKFDVRVSATFKKQAKRLIKKFPSLKHELDELVNSLESDPKLGKPIGQDCFKIRLIIASKKKGKSGGARIITHLHIIKNTVYLLTIYDKSEQSTISEKELRELLHAIFE